ncbi:MAG: biotin/lipoyl-containing protein, partial [Frankiaceae bacterium]
MSVSVTMPRLGESVSEGTVTRWLKKEGERVEADEPLLEVSTDKVDTEIPAPSAGVVVAIRVSEDVTVDVGTELAVIDETGAGAAAGGGTQAGPEQSEAEAPAADAAAAEAPAAEAPAAEEPPGDADTGQQIALGPLQGDGHAPAYVTPLVRRLAAERGVDLARLRGTGVGGRIRKQDVLDAARSSAATSTTPASETSRAASPAAGAPAAPPAAPPTAAPAAPAAPAPAAAPAATEQPVPAAGLSPALGRTERMSRLRGLIARRMVESLQVSAQLTTVVEADLTGIARLRDRAQDAFAAREGVRLSFLPFFAVAVVEALKVHP